MHNSMQQFPLFFSLAIKTCKILYLDVIIKDVVVVVAFPCLPNMTTIAMDLIIRERERKVSIFMLCIHTETERLREKLGERREFC